MPDQPPLLSIGLAVYNGAEYLVEAVESLLGQSLCDFELIISDNASTDETPQICEEFARRDARIRYHRNPRNIGGANNENQTFRMARGKYFRWAAHDDVCAPQLLERCVAVLEQHPEVVLCYTQVVEIDARGTHGRLISRNHAASADPCERFRNIATASDFCEETYGVIRSDILRKTRLQQNYTASDRTLLCELALHGPFWEVQEPLFLKRFHPKNQYTDWRARMVWFDDKFEGKISLPFWLQFFDYLETIRRVPLSLTDKVRCYAVMSDWLRVFGKNMAKDVIVAAYMAGHSEAWRKKKHARARIWE